jgi:hypothetical protein
MNSKFYTKRGELTRYALACGYIEKRGTDEAYAKLEQICSNGTLRVIVGGRWYRGDWLYHGTNLTDARKIFKNCDPIALNSSVLL